MLSVNHQITLVFKPGEQTILSDKELEEPDV